MADRMSPAALRSALQTLRGYLDDLVRSSFEDHATKLRLFVNYFQKDDTVRYLADRLHVRLRDVLKAALAPKLELPQDPLDRLAFIYEVLFHLKQGLKLDVREFLSRGFEGGSIEAKWDDFRRTWLNDLFEGLSDLSDRVETLVAGVDKVDPEEVFFLALHAGDEEIEEQAAATSGEGEPANAPPEVAPARPATNGATRSTPPSLRVAVAMLPAGQRADLETELEILELECRKTKPDRERLDEIVGTFWLASPELGELARKQVEASTAPKPAPSEPPPSAPAPKTAAPTPAAKKPAAKPATKRPAAPKKPAAKKPAAKKPAAKKPAAKKPAAKPAAKKPAAPKKPAAKKPAAKKPAAKKPAAKKPTAKASTPRKAAKSRKAAPGTRRAKK